MELKGRTFIVTGASAGMGRALAVQLSREGSNLVLNARESAPLTRAAAECEAAGVVVDYVAGDAGLERTAADVVAKAVQIGDFSGFVHNAGVVRPGPYLWELSQDHFNEVMAANLLAGYQLVRFAVPELLKRWEGIAVFVGSGAAEINLPGIGAYSVAKAAEEHMARQLAEEAPQIVTLVYRPGVVDTRLQAQAREATGGAAKFLHKEFRAYKDRGMLISPADAAGALVRIIARNPDKFHGKICTWRDGN
ncbi:MAG: SDR family NAD(P)-dependent oxidoreductase [Deltaproteobacteria bacterium]